MRHIGFSVDFKVLVGERHADTKHTSEGCGQNKKYAHVSRRTIYPPVLEVGNLTHDESNE